MTNILVVDDDERIARLLVDYLSDAGFSVKTAASAEEFWAVFTPETVDLVTLDLGLPGEDGLTLARKVRQTSTVPIIIVTAQDEMVDRVVGLEVGADDYIAKPFHMREVLARVRAVLRRPQTIASTTETPPPPHGEDILAFADWTLNRATRQLLCPKGKEVELTSGEYEILRALAECAPRVLSRDQLMDLARGTSWTPYDRSIDTMVGRLRRKMAVGCDPHALIKTVRGAGYMLATPAKHLSKPIEADQARQG